VQTGGAGKAVEDGQKGVHVVTPTPLHSFLTSNSTPPNSVGIACFGRLTYGTTFLFVQKFHYLGNFFEKNVLLHIPKSIKTHLKNHHVSTHCSSK
jgi:hypothetical protein